MEVVEEDVVPADGFIIGKTDLGQPRKVSKRKDKGAEQFWAQLKDFRAVCKLKAMNKTWGARNILQDLSY